MALKCRKFEPNIFNKLKCQSCFGAKEHHSAEALQNNKASRKVSKCGYLFVAPDYDFNNPLDKSRRWQRRLFRLYDDGELSYYVDEDPDTIPQQIVDMNKCTEVKDAEKLTTHHCSLAVITPDKTTYIKAASKEEIMWWHDALVVYPRSLQKPKNRRFTMPIFSSKDKIAPLDSGRLSGESADTAAITTGRFQVEKVKPKETHMTYRGVRNMKHKGDKHLQDGLRKSSSLHDLSSDEVGLDLAASRYLSRSGEQLDKLNGAQNILNDPKVVNNPYFTLPRNTWQTLANNSRQTASQPALTQPLAPPSSATKKPEERSGITRPKNTTERNRLHRERSSSLKDFHSQFTLAPEKGNRTSLSGIDRLTTHSDSVDGTSDRGSVSSVYSSKDNETDELKMAKSSELQAAGRSQSASALHPAGAQASVGTRYEDLMYMKKGWLIKQGISEKDWKKHWFVLTGNSLRYYKDAKAEETNTLDGRIDLSTCYDIVEVSIGRNYGFRIKTRNGEYLLSAMTSGIRNNWMKAVRLVMDLQNSNVKSESKSSSTDSSRQGSEELDQAAVNGRLGTAASSDSKQDTKKKESLKNSRRHHSDINLAVNVGQLLKVNEMSDSLEGLDLGNVQVPEQSTLSRDIADAGDEPKLKMSASDSAVDSLPLNRFVEGSENVTPVSASTTSVDPTRPKKSESKKEEDERKQRAKSPSARIKDKTRSKAQKVSSDDLRMAIPGSDKDDTKYSSSDGDTGDQESSQAETSYHSLMDDNLTASSGDGMLVELLETEVDSLKDQLDHTHDEIVKLHETNMDLKNRLQTAVREKDVTQPQTGLESPIIRSMYNDQNQDSMQVTTMRRQVKEARETIQKQKQDIETLQAKLAMSTSKLTGTEKALSEALKELKQEKDKFMKLSNDWNRKIRSLENQLKEVNGQFDRQKSSVTAKENDNKRLDNELKASHVRCNELERQIKSYELEKKRLKDNLDDTNRKVALLKDELKMKEGKLQEIESHYENQIAELEQEFAQERDDVEQHMEDLKKQWMEAQRKTDESDSLTNNMADIIGEKDEIINQLEEKMIECDKKMCDITEDYNSKLQELKNLQSSSKKLKEENKKLEKKLEDLEKSKSKIHTDRSKIDNESESYKKQYDDVKKENISLMEELETEKQSLSDLIKEKAELEHSVNRLEMQVQDSRGRSNDSTSSDNSTVKEMIHNFIMIESEMQELTQSVEDIQTIFSDYLCDKEEEDHVELVGVAQMVDDVHSHCNKLLDILKEGSKELGMESPEKDSSSSEMSSKFEEAMSQVKKLKSELKDSHTQYELMKNSEKELTTKLRNMETRYQGQIDAMSEKIEKLYSRCEKNVKQMPKPQPKTTEKGRHSLELSEQIEAQLTQLEEKISIVEQVLPNISLPPSEEDEDTGSEIDEDSDSFESSEEDGSESDDESEPSDILSKLKQMKSQLERTNNRIQDLTCDLSDQTFSSANDSTADGDSQQLRSTLQKCGEKIDSLTTRFTENVRMAKSGVVPGSLASVHMFKNCVNDVKQKLKDINKIVTEHEVLDAKGLKVINDKIYKLFEYLAPYQRLQTSDFEIIGQVLQQKTVCQSAIVDKENAAKRKHLGYEDKLHVYADRLSVEAIVLGQMASLIQQHHVTNLYRDQLMNEINSLNQVLYELKKKVDSVSHSPTSGNVVSMYASVLAEKIILEGQLASCAVTDDHHPTDDTAILSSLNISDNPSIMAMEVFLRSQVDSSVYRQLQRSGELLDNATAQVVTRFLLQGEITQALQKIKDKYRTDTEHEKVQDLVIRQRKFCTEELIERHETVSESIDVHLKLVLYLIKQSPNKKQALESFINLLKRIFQRQSTELQELHSGNNFEQNKSQQVCSTLQSDLDQLLSQIPKVFDEVSDPSTEVEESVETLSTQVADMLLQKSVTKGWLTYICHLNQSNSVPVVVEVENQSIDGHSQALSQSLMDEATSKQTLSVELKSQNKESEKLTNFVNALPDIGLFNPENMDSYSENLVKEAIFQSQLTYLTFKMKLEHERQMRDLKIKLESGQKVALTSVISKDSEGDIQSSLSVFEEILETKFEDECEVLSNLDKELKQLQSITSDNPELSKELTNFASMFDHELSVAQERHDIHLDVLRQEMTAICIRMETVAESNETEKESLICEYEDRIKRMQDELVCVKIDHEEELEQVRQDIMTAVCAIKANEEEEPDHIKHKMLQHKHAVLILLEDIQSSLGGVNNDLVKKLKEQIEELKAVFLTIEDPTDDPAAVMSPVAKDGDVYPDRRISISASNLEPPGTPGLDISHHEHELELLKKQKDDALAEEIKTTKAALDAMRKAYEEDLEEEKQKYRDALKSMFTDDFVEEIRRRHETEMSKTTEELKQLRMHYDSKCEDYKVLESKSDNTKSAYETHIKHLTTSNQQLQDLVNEEIGKLKDFIQNRTMASVPGNGTIEEELYDAQIMVRVKDAELQKLRSQTKNLQNSLDRSSEEQRVSMTQYFQLNKKYQESQKQLKEILEEKRAEEAKSSRSLRRAPSFHHRARSPSPQPTTSPNKKDAAEHHSRDSHRRRHIDARDLKRSKSSPSIPYVFDGRPVGSLGKSKDLKKLTRSPKS
ncbi:major antigen-like isoform X1 [Mytilus trossulus]|uniref:major antigen-like isoform X1 n=2 Tax=Mytilus trossulus TaxID=6551 RepID=UPI003005E164